MKTERISGSIIKNYNKLSSMAEANVKKVDSNYLPVWGLEYKHEKLDGFVSKFGIISCGKTEIDIHNGKINKIKKPFFSTWKKALKRVDNMLQNMAEKFDNKNGDGERVVKQNQINLLVFSQEAVRKIQEAQMKIADKLSQKSK